MRIVLPIVALLLVVSAITPCSGNPEQPQNPIIAILSEPVTHSECVSMYQHILNLSPSRKEEGNHVGGNGGGNSFRTVAGAASEKLSQALENNNGRGNQTLPPVPGPGGCIWSVYVDWLEASGIRVLPVPWDATDDKLTYVLERVNGVLLAGGILGWVPTTHAKFFKVVQKIYRYVIDQNEKGVPMVLWGTCQGFEMLNAAAAGDFSIVKKGFKGMNPLMMQVNFTSWAAESQLFGTSESAISVSGTEVRDYMQHEPTTLNWHMYGIPPEEYINNTRLNASGVRPLTTTNDVTGRTFTSSVESTKGPIFGVQFHPERVMFELDNNNIFHTDHAIEVSEYLANFLVGQLRSNNHTFENTITADSLLIANYPRFNLGGGIRIYNI